MIYPLFTRDSIYAVLTKRASFDFYVIVHENVHWLIHATDEKTILRYRSLLQLDGKQLKKLNHFRKGCNLVALV